VSILATIAGNVEKAFAQAKVAADPYGAALNQIASEAPGNVAAPQSLVFDWTTTSNSGAPAFPSGVVQFDIRGDWLYVDRGSCGRPTAWFGKSDAEDDSFILAPGRLIEQSFQGLTLLVADANVEFGGAPIVTSLSIVPAFAKAKLNPCLVLFYGTGPCPFEESFVEESDAPILLSNYLEATITAAQDFVAWAVPPGCVVDMSMAFAKVGTAATTYQPVVEVGSFNYSNALVATQFGGYNMRVPDVAQLNGVTNATNAAYSYVKAKFKMPKNHNMCFIRALEVQNNPNNFSNVAASCLVS